MKFKITSFTNKLNIFANSPKVVKIFGPLLILMLLGAAIYGGYILYNQRYGDAASSGRNTWYYNSAGINHNAGVRKYFKLWDGTSGGGITDLPSTNSRAVWLLDVGNGDIGKIGWFGPNKHLTPERQYIGCFFYSMVAFRPDSKAVVEVVNNNAGSISSLRADFVQESLTTKAGKFDRTCLAFYIPKSMKENSIQLRVRLVSGGILIRKTKLSGITRSNNELLNQWIFKSGPDNDSITRSSGFTD